MSDDATINGMIERTAQENLQMHRPIGLVARCRHRSSAVGDRSPHPQEACREIFGDVLEQFGYEV
jgi:hypothetical protein